ncbi:MAG: GtrA family protein [Luteimonas sp.]|nr:GtrA family protein [Luteimonas sp.]
MRADSPIRRKAAFVLSGGTGFALYYVFSLLLVRLPGVEHEVAAFVAVLLSVPPTYLLQRNFTFRHRGGVSKSFAGYCLLQAFNAVAIGALAWCGRKAGLPAEINFLAAGGVAVVVSYVVLSRLVFRQDQG